MGKQKERDSYSNTSCGTWMKNTRVWIRFASAWQLDETEIYGLVSGPSWLRASRGLRQEPVRQMFVRLVLQRSHFGRSGADRR